MRIVFDLNILASAAVSPEGVPAILVDTIVVGPHIMILSVAMLERLEKVLERPYFSSRLTHDQRARTMLRYRDASLLSEIDASIVGFGDDAEDDLVLGTAVAGNADVIVTGDKGLLALHPFRGIPILTAREFIRLVDPGRPGDR